MTEFDKDIQRDVDNNDIYPLALVAQDLRNTLRHVAPRSYVAALKRKRAAEKRKAKV